MVVVEQEISDQAKKASRIAVCLNITICNNKSINTENKSRIYKTAISLIMTYTAGTRPKTTRTKSIMEIAEIRILRKVVGKTL